MTSQEKSKHIFEAHLTAQRCDENESAIEASLVTVNSIIEAIKITTDHLELTINEEHEVSKDIQFWNDVKKQIQS